jgi:hypothetical protein
MNSPNFDSSGDNEPWDGKGELEWTEKNWKQFLKDADSEVGRFIKIYQSLKNDPQRLDHTALGMGWDSEEWSADLDFEDDEQPEWLDSSSDDDDFEDMDDSDPYTIHKHPLYVTTRALYTLLSYYWRVIVMEHPDSLNVFDCQQFGESLRIGESNAVMGIHALEMGDYSLVVCHMQRSLESLNTSLGGFHKVTSSAGNPVGKSFIDEFHCCFFDLREIWLRVIKECRGTSDFR